MPVSKGFPSEVVVANVIVAAGLSTTTMPVRSWKPEGSGLLLLPVLQTRPRKRIGWAVGVQGTTHSLVIVIHGKMTGTPTSSQAVALPATVPAAVKATPTAVCLNKTMPAGVGVPIHVSPRLISAKVTV